MSETIKNSPLTGQPYDPWQELAQGEFGPPAPAPESTDLIKQRELGLDIQEQRGFYAALGQVTRAVIEGGSEDDIERLPAKTAFQRFHEKRVEKKLDKLVGARMKYDSSHKGGNTQEYGIRPAVRQQQRLRDANKRYKNGELTHAQLQSEKLRIRATRSEESAVRGFGQRRNHREGLVRSTQARMIPEIPFLAKQGLKRMEKKLAKMQGVDTKQRAQAENIDTDDDSSTKRRTLAKQAVKTMAKTAKDDVKAVGKYAGRNAKRFYDRKKTEATTGYQDGLAGNQNEGKVFPIFDEKIVKPLARKAGQKIGEHQARKQGESQANSVQELNPSADKTVVLVGGVTEGIKTLDDLGQALAEQDLHVVSFDYTNQTTEALSGTEYHPRYHTAKTQQLEEILYNLEGREDVTLFAHSQGAVIAVEAALTDPSKIKHLILANPSGLFEDSVAGIVKRFGTETIRKTLTMKKPALKQQVFGGKEMLTHPKNFLGDAVDIARSDIRSAIKQLRSQGVKVDVLLGAKDQVFPWKKISDGLNPTNDSVPYDIVVDSVSSYFTTKVDRKGKAKQHKFASKWAGHDQPIIYPEQTAKLVQQLISSK